MSFLWKNKVFICLLFFGCFLEYRSSRNILLLECSEVMNIYNLQISIYFQESTPEEKPLRLFVFFFKLGAIFNPGFKGT